MDPAWEVGLTRLFQPGARLIRRPLYLRGARNISFGTDVEINDYVHIGSVRQVTIGNRRGTWLRPER